MGRTLGICYLGNVICLCLSEDRNDINLSGNSSWGRAVRWGSSPRFSPSDAWGSQTNSETFQSLDWSPPHWSKLGLSRSTSCAQLQISSPITCLWTALLEHPSAWNRCCLEPATAVISICSTAYHTMLTGRFLPIDITLPRDESIRAESHLPGLWLRAAPPKRWVIFGL